ALLGSRIEVRDSAARIPRDVPESPDRDHRAAAHEEARGAAEAPRVPWRDVTGRDRERARNVERSPGHREEARRIDSVAKYADRGYAEGPAARRRMPARERAARELERRQRRPRLAIDRLEVSPNVED